MRQPVDKQSEHLAHLFLGAGHTLFGLGLLQNHVLEAALHVIQPAQGQRRHSRCLQRIGLAFEPPVIGRQGADVLNDEL